MTDVFRLFVRVLVRKDAWHLPRAILALAIEQKLNPVVDHNLLKRHRRIPGTTEFRLHDQAGWRGVCASTNPSRF